MGVTNVLAEIRRVLVAIAIISWVAIAVLQVFRRDWADAIAGISVFLAYVMGKVEGEGSLTDEPGL